MQRFSFSRNRFYYARASFSRTTFIVMKEHTIHGRVFRFPNEFSPSDGFLLLQIDCLKFTNFHE